MPDPDIWDTREDWALAVVLLGAHGYRPKLTPQGVLAYRSDDATITITGDAGSLPSPRYDAALTLTLRDAAGAELHRDTIAFDDEHQLIAAVLARFAAHPPDKQQADGFIRHFPPPDELDRLTLSAAYAAYRPELDALAARGIHAYLEDSGFGMRMYCDISRSLLLDISIDDEGVLPAGPQDGEWVVFITGPDGHEAEFTVDRLNHRDEDAHALANAASDALTRVLREEHMFLEHYDRRVGRLDPPLWPVPGA